MNGIYFSNYNLEDESSGVSKKINYQISALKKNNINIKHPNFTPKSKKSIFISKIMNLFPILPNYFGIKLKKSLDNFNFNNIDFVYLRKTTIDKNVLYSLKKIKTENNNIKIILEIPTYPYDKEYKGIIKKMNLIKDIRNRSQLKNYIDRIVTYSKDQYIFDIPAIQISNAANISEVEITNTEYDNNEGYEKDKEINIIVVALFAYWHGYDRFLKGLKVYIENGGRRKITLHMVGKGKELKNYKKYINENGLNDFVVIYNELYGEELDRIYSKSSLALDSLGRHRSKVFYNSSLKGKEYGAKGLPIISGVETELDEYQSYKYYLRVKSDDSPIDINSIIAFHDKIYSNENINQVKSNIKIFTKSNFSIGKVVQPIIQYLKND